MRDLSPHVRWIVIPMHLLGIAALVILALHFQWWMLPAIWAGWFVTGCLGAEIGLHRLYSHRAFPLRSRPLRWLLGWCACMAGQWSPIFWAAMHRGYHHPSCDTERDIHSPVHGRWHAYMGWMVSLRETDVQLRYARDLISDPLHQFLHRHYLTIFWGSLLALLALLAMVGWALSPLVILPVLLAMHQENLVNLLCHLPTPGSYRNFDIADHSVNIYPLGLLIWGQGFHNNHHARPKHYNFGYRPYEFDLCRWVVPALVWLDQRFHKKVTYARQS